MKRTIHVALAALMLLGMIAGAGATPVAASGTDVTTTTMTASTTTASTSTTAKTTTS